MSAAATPLRTVTRAGTRTRTSTRLRSPSSPERTGAGASSTRPSSSGPGVSTAETAPLAETPDLQGAFPRLSDEQIGMLAQHGERRRTQQDEILFREGDKHYDFFVVLEGKVAVIAGYGGHERLSELISQDSILGDLILRAFLQRREMLIGLGAGLTIIGSRYSHDTRRLR